MFLRVPESGFPESLEPLGLSGQRGLALLSGHADVLLPLVLASEAVYVGLLGSHPKFQEYVDAQRAKANRAEDSQVNQQTLQQILRTLPPDALQRFETLRTQCLELRQIAMDIRRPGAAAVDVPLDQIQLTGLDRLLWIHLRLLYTQVALAKFLKKTSADQIQKGIHDLEQQLQQLPADDKDDRRAASSRRPARQSRYQPQPPGEPDEGRRRTTS